MEKDFSTSSAMAEASWWRKFPVRRRETVRRTDEVRRKEARWKEHYMLYT
jgi:hypothetical protein